MSKIKMNLEQLFTTSSFLVSLIIKIDHYKPKKNFYCSKTFKSYPKRSEQFLGTVDTRKALQLGYPDYYGDNFPP